MDLATARTVWAVIFCVEVVVWLVALQYLLNTVRQANASPDAGPDLDGIAPGNWVVGSTEVEGQPAALAERATTLLVKDGGLGLLKIVERGADRVHFEAPAGGVGDPPLAAGAPGGLRQGQLRFAPLGSNRTRVDYAVELSRSLRGALVAGAIIQAAGLLVLAVGGWAVYTFLASSDNPVARWQTFQMLQAAHLLWPPFLCAKLYRTFRRRAAARLETFVHNLPYYKD